jgi:hypothetical protein
MLLPGHSWIAETTVVVIDELRLVRASGSREIAGGPAPQGWDPFAWNKRINAHCQTSEVVEGGGHADAMLD